MLDSSHHRAKSSRAWLGSTESRSREQINPRHAWMCTSWMGSEPFPSGKGIRPRLQNPGHHAPDSSGLTRNHAAYSAGRNTSVSTVPTIRPPMIEIAIDP